MKEKLRNTVAVLLLLGDGACAAGPSGPVPGSEPVLHPPGGRIEFSRKCADEDSYRVNAYARMEAPEGRARAVVAVLAGYPDTGGEAVRIDVHLQRLQVDGGRAWRDAPYTVRLLARSAATELAGPAVGSFLAHEQGPQGFRTGAAGTADWITFVEPGEEAEGAADFYHVGPDLGFTVADLGVESPRDEVELALEIGNKVNGETIRLVGPFVRVPERVWMMTPPAPRALGLLETLNPKEEGGLPRFFQRAWKYRKCIEERRAAKRFLGRYIPGPGTASSTRPRQQ